jgi:hypothetical protein
MCRLVIVFLAETANNGAVEKGTPSHFTGALLSHNRRFCSCLRGFSTTPQLPFFVGSLDDVNLYIRAVRRQRK